MRFYVRQPRLNMRPQDLLKISSLIGLCLSVILWVAALPQVRPEAMNSFGLISVLPWTFYAALVVLTASFSIAICRPKLSRGILLSHIALFIVIIHATPELSYETLRYAWAWKHLGIIDFILRHGTVDMTIVDMGAYHNWPGFFAAAALFTSVAGLESLVKLAGWSPTLFNLLNIGALLLLFSALVREKRQMWLALWLVALTSWVAQDYFSPQAFAFFLHLVALGVAATWFVRPTPARSPTDSRVAIMPPYSFDRPGSHEVPKRYLLGLLLVLLALFATLASSHQLTPIVTVLCLCVISIFSQSNVRSSLPLLMTVVTVTWMIYGATPYFQEAFIDLITSFGQLGSNLESTLVDLTHMTPEERLVAFAGRFLTLTVWSLAFAGVLVHFARHRKRSDWRLILLAGAPFLLLAANSYGGEVQFRIYLYSLPFMALWIASFLGFDSNKLKTGRHVVLVLTTSLVFLASFLLAYYGKEKRYYFTPTEVEAAELMYRTAPSGSLIIELNPNYPSRHLGYENFTHVSITLEPEELRGHVLRNPVRTMRNWMSNPDYADAFLIITQSQINSVVPALPEPRHILVDFQQAIARAPEFERIYESDDAVVFRLVDRPREVQP